MVTATKGLENSDAVHRFFDRSRKVSGLVLAQTRDRVVVTFKLETLDPDWNRTDEEDKPEDPVKGEENGEADDDGQAVRHKKHETE